MVITIGREYGSGGKYIGTELSRQLGLPFYDKELLEQIAAQEHLDLELIQQQDELGSDSYLDQGSLFSSSWKKESLNEKIFEETTQLIRKLSTEDCIIIGRCANDTLRNSDAIHVFIYASDITFKIQRKMQYEQLSEKEALEKISTVDKRRSVYYHYHTGGKWGAKEEYDLCIDTSKVGVEQAVKLIAFYYTMKKEQN
ncbi:MAG: AAA family ATPase [Peptococcaceae bacterium]